MGFRIIGWTDYDSDYPSISVASENVSEFLSVIIEEISANGYMISGEEHQNRGTGVPLFEDGTCFRASMRAWGFVMSAAYPLLDGKETGYMDFYMSTPTPTKLPEQVTLTIEPQKSDNFSGFISTEDRQILSESLAVGLPFITADKALRAIMDGINRQEAEE